MPNLFSITYAISHIPAEVTLPLLPWEPGWGGGDIQGWRWVKTSANPPFCQRKESKAFSGTASVKVTGHKQT